VRFQNAFDGVVYYTVGCCHIDGLVIILEAFLENRDEGFDDVLARSLYRWIVDLLLVCGGFRG
jgi:hypothetical protein